MNEHRIKDKILIRHVFYHKLYPNIEQREFKGFSKAEPIGLIISFLNI